MLRPIPLWLLFLFLLGLALCIGAWFQRARAGFGRGKAVSQDDVRLVSPRYGLSGRPDRIVKVGRQYIPEEKKPGSKVTDAYRAQLGVYLLLVEEHYGIRPSYGVLVLGDGRRVKIPNTEDLRAWVLAMAADIRQHRQRLDVVLPPSANPRHCLGCGQRDQCTVRLA
jgi:CRISPR-associated exonuclease Cas4